jgi:hypothetical protein
MRHTGKMRQRCARGLGHKDLIDAPQDQCIASDIKDKISHNASENASQASIP